MKTALLAALGVAMIVGGEAFAFLGGLDLILFGDTGTAARIGAGVALAVSAALAAWAFRHVLRGERTLAAELARPAEPA